MVEILEPGANDVDALVELWGDLAAYHAALDPAFAQSPGWRASYGGYLAALMGRGDALVLMARVDGRLAGYGVARISLLPPFFADRRRGFIQDVYTVPEFRRHGIARRLVTELLDWLGREDVATVELTVAAGNAEAIALWESLGFHPYMQHYRRRV